VKHTYVISLENLLYSKLCECLNVPFTDYLGISHLERIISQGFDCR